MVSHPVGRIGRGAMLERLRESIGRRLATSIVTRSHALRLDRPIVSFTFDDVPVSAATVGADLLAARGVAGTFYVCGDLAGQSWSEYDLASFDSLADLARHGHEIGCHTARHVRPGALAASAYVADVERNARLLEPRLGTRLQTFAYPYGAIRLDVKLRLQGRFRACRGIHGGVNRDRIDLGRLKASPLEAGPPGWAGIDRLLDDTARHGGWLVFYAHDVTATPTNYGVTPDLLARAVDTALERGCTVETVAAALDRAGVP